MAAVAAGYVGDPSPSPSARAARWLCRGRRRARHGGPDARAVGHRPATSSPAAAEPMPAEGLDPARETEQPPAVAIHLALLATVSAVRGDGKVTLERARRRSGTSPYATG